MTPERSRTHTWQDPHAWLPHLTGRSGLEVLQAMAAGELPGPPIASTLGFSDVTVVEGDFSVTMAPQEFHYNPIGSVHGGVISALLDTATGCAVQSTLPAGTAYTSLDLSVRFIRAVRMQTGPVTARGRVLHRGGRTVVAEADLVDGRGRLLAHATSTCLVLEPAAPRS